MTWKQIRKSRWYRILTNKYMLISIFFVIWMLFLDSNSWLNHEALEEQIEEKQTDIDYYRKEIEQVNRQRKELNNPEGLEKYAREKYHMKRADEEVYIIEKEDSTRP